MKIKSANNNYHLEPTENEYSLSTNDAFAVYPILADCRSVRSGSMSRLTRFPTNRSRNQSKKRDFSLTSAAPKLSHSFIDITPSLHVHNCYL